MGTHRVLPYVLHLLPHFNFYLRGDTAMEQRGTFCLPASLRQAGLKWLLFTRNSVKRAALNLVQLQSEMTTGS